MKRAPVYQRTVTYTTRYTLPEAVDWFERAIVLIFANIISCLADSEVCICFLYQSANEVKLSFSARER